MLIQQNKLRVMACYMDVVHLIYLIMIFLYKYFYFYSLEFGYMYSHDIHRYSYEDVQLAFTMDKYDFTYPN